MKVCEARQARSMWGNATLGFLVSMATLGCTPLQPPGAAPQRTATPGGVTAASPVPSGSGISAQQRPPAPATAPATSPVYGAAVPTPAPATATATPAVPAAPVPVPVLGFDEALQAAANALFSSARLPPDAPPPAALVIDPLIDGMSGEQSAATRTMEARIVDLVKGKYPQFDLQPFSAARVAKSPIVLVGTFTPINAQGQSSGPREAYRICLALADLRTGKIIAKGSARARMDGIDATPTGYFRDSPAWMMERATDGYIKTCQATRVGDPINPAYLDGILASGLVAEAIKAFEAGRYRESLDFYASALATPSGSQLRVYNGMYLANVKLGRRDAATDAFAKIVDHGLASKRLAVKFLFSPGSTAFLPSPAVSGPYPSWLQQIAQRTEQGKACLEISGHTSRTGPEPLNERLSLLRAEFIKQRLVAQAPKLGNRSITNGMGSRANLIGTGRDDLTDALDRRVVFSVIDC